MGKGSVIRAFKRFKQGDGTQQDFFASGMVNVNDKDYEVSTLDLSIVSGKNSWSGVGKSQVLTSLSWPSTLLAYLLPDTNMP